MTSTARIGPGSTFDIAPTVYARAFGDEVVLLDFGRGEYFGLDEVGAVIWRGLERGMTVQAIADAVVDRFDVSGEQALADAITLVVDLEASGLVGVSSAGPR